MCSVFLVVVVASFVGCKKDAPPTPAPAPVPVVVSAAERDRAFWKWVAAHVEELKQVKTGHEPVTDGLSAELEKVEPGLVFELGVGREAFELIISADGEKQRFPTVKRLVAAAGELPGTKVIAFRPRKDIDGFSMQVGEKQKLSGANLWFTSAEDPEKPGLLAVTLSVEGLTEGSPDALREASFMLLEAAVGEYDLETKIGAIDIVPAPTKPTAEMKKLKELPALLDARK